MNIPEAKDENKISLAKAVRLILKTHTEVDLQPIDIVALHRIPTKRGHICPVLCNATTLRNLPSCGREL
ncbi:hypothetical protein DPMN_077181 [Dreissena polymorpha]|uniref:Uncharacterized protein n=1 Tax=Dreissena polymorpha TaxID=45954 RepID=A0A9D3YPH4_DREPO|nr:hypothetical protein DPMN_077181 [Dreissena polymorpha]